MPIMPVTAFQVPSSHQPAGSHAKLKVEWVPDQPILDRQSRQQARPGHLLTTFVLSPIDHGLNLSTKSRLQKRQEEALLCRSGGVQHAEHKHRQHDQAYHHIQAIAFKIKTGHSHGNARYRRGNQQQKAKLDQPHAVHLHC